VHSAPGITLKRSWHVVHVDPVEAAAQQVKEEVVESLEAALPVVAIN